MKKSLFLACIAAGAFMACSAFPYSAAAAPAATAALVANGGFETGGTMPAGWSADGADAAHHLSLTKNDPHTGKQAAKMVVEAGAASSFFGYGQYIHVTPGSYTFSAWVKADKVTGRMVQGRMEQGGVGWFYHVYKGHDMVVNNSLNVNTDLTGWNQVTATVTVPDGADTVQIGTSLYSTGTAYFDDATLTKAANGKIKNR